MSLISPTEATCTVKKNFFQIFKNNEQHFSIIMMLVETIYSIEKLGTNPIITVVHMNIIFEKSMIVHVYYSPDRQVTMENVNRKNSKLTCGFARCVPILSIKSVMWYTCRLIPLTYRLWTQFMIGLPSLILIVFINPMLIDFIW